MTELSAKTASKHAVMENILKALQFEHRAEKLCVEASGRLGGGLRVCLQAARKFEAAVRVGGPYWTTQAGNEPLCMLGGVSRVGEEPSDTSHRIL